MDHCQVLPPLRPLQEETAVVGCQQGLPCWSICKVTTGQEAVVDGFLASPHLISIPRPRRQGPSTYEEILSDHPRQSDVLTRCGLPRSPRGHACHQSSTGRMPPEDVVDGRTSQTHATSNITLPHALTGKCKHFMTNTYRGWTGHYYNNHWELRKICNCWFELATVWKNIWGNDHLSSTFGLRRCHLALKSGKARSDFVGSSHRYISC